MPVPSFPGLDNHTSPQDIVDYLVQVQRQLKYLLESGLDSENIRAGSIVADRIKANSITADRMNVTQLSAIAADLGHITAGLINAVTITGSLIQTAAPGTYPRIVLDSAAQLLKLYFDANNTIEFNPNSSGAPAIVISNNSSVQFTLSIISGTLGLITQLGDILLKSQLGDVNISAPIGNVNFDNWSAMKNLATGSNLQADLNAKANTFSGASGTVYASSTLGGAADTAITFSNGIRTS